MPDFVIIAGPNGSGKSSFIDQVRSSDRVIDFQIPFVINPDVIAKQINPAMPDQAIREAAEIALQERNEAIKMRIDFAIETTLSGHSEIRLIRQATSLGYRLILIYIALNSPDINFRRVQIRAQTENRTVPERDVRRRYERSIMAVSTIIDQVDIADFYDNSLDRFSHVARLRKGHRVGETTTFTPAWARRALGSRLDSI